MIVVSACLAGFNCRYDGDNNENEKIVELVKKGEAIPVCPEQLGGLTTPRKPVELKEGSALTKDGEDLTEEFMNGANQVLDICKKYHCKKAILKAKSPSCGSGLIHNGNFEKAFVKGNGITAQLLKDNGIHVISENDI